jgi:hypothetical protein
MLDRVRELRRVPARELLAHLGDASGPAFDAVARSRRPGAR